MHSKADKKLCLDCGLCCDGTMYNYVLLQAADNQEQLDAAGVPLVRQAEETSFKQPCMAYKAGCCSIYDMRPVICREYRCALLRSHESGEITAGEARFLIEDTIALRDRVRQQVEAFLTSEVHIALPVLFQVMVENLEGMTPLERKQVNAQMLLDVGTLRVLLAKRFEPHGTRLEKTPLEDTAGGAGGEDQGGQ